MLSSENLQDWKNKPTCQKLQLCKWPLEAAYKNKKGQQEWVLTPRNKLAFFALPVISKSAGYSFHKRSARSLILGFGTGSAALPTSITDLGHVHVLQLESLRPKTEARAGLLKHWKSQIPLEVMRYKDDESRKIIGQQSTVPQKEI